MTDLLAPQDWSFPVPIAYGPGRIAEIGALAARAGMTRPLVVTDRGSAGLPFVGDILGHLRGAGLAPALHAGIAPNPRDADVPEGCAAYRAGGHDGIVAVGGGSGMDGAKAIALTVQSGVPLADFNYVRPAPDLAASAFPPLITVPTTAGTGAETESTAMITEVAGATKYCAWHAALKPAHVILDPALTVGLPRDLTAWTGVDALVHAIEAYTVPGFHPLCDGAALEGLRLIWQHLPRAVAEPGSLEARGGMLVGSCLAGIAFLKGLGMVHAISHMVGAEYDSHHGLTNAVLLVPVLRFNAPALGARARPMAEAMGLEDRSVAGIDRAVTALLDRLEIPRRLSDLGVTPDRAGALAAKAMTDPAAATNARAATEAEVAALIADSLTAGR